MNVAIVASECAPFAKTGGLADVVGALPKSLEHLGADVRVFLPKYNTVDESKYTLHYQYNIGEMPIRVGGIPWPVHVLRSSIPGSSVPVYFIDCPHFFHRGKIYTNDSDEDRRFILFTKGVIEALQRLQWTPDVIHCNDWQTGLLPVMVKDNYAWDQLFAATGTLYSIHNIGYQGLFARSAADAAEMGPRNADALAMYLGVSFMKGGILFSEILSTVSETYAKEILTPQFGSGMESDLARRRDDLYGVLNGIDVDDWNPATDPHLPHHYSVTSLDVKRRNKQFLLDKIGMEYNADRPLIGVISRLVAQKGFDLVAGAAERLMELDAQWVILGSGEDSFENLFSSLHYARPQNVWSYIGFNNELAHLIEAASDMFLMPSQYEPCGLNQMYSLRYGSIPIVRNTGGLADTVHDWHEHQARGSTEGNGFLFDDATPYALYTTVERAVNTFYIDKDAWRQMMINGMSADYSWDSSARKYMRLYEMAMEKRRLSQ
ncbi:MAG: glycogen synthase [Ignavibacteriae bacterium]|nr:glycogen synthase [Ignavibacteriota bacterium]